MLRHKSAMARRATVMSSNGRVIVQRATSKFRDGGAVARRAISKFRHGGVVARRVTVGLACGSLILAALVTGAVGHQVTTGGALDQGAQVAAAQPEPQETAPVATATPQPAPTAQVNLALPNRLPSSTAQTPNPTAAPSGGQTDPSADPARVVATSRGSRPTPDISSNEKFIAAVAEAAQESQLDSKVPASVTIAQAILESDWGKSQLAKKAQNYFGIKSSSGPGPAGVISMNTWEVIGGANVTVNDGFKAYHNLWESVLEHGHFLADNRRYAPAFKFPNDPKEFARQIHLAGYATDPAYTSKLVNLMNKFNLYQYDLK